MKSKLIFCLSILCLSTVAMSLELKPINPATQKIPVSNGKFIHPGILLGREQLAELWTKSIMAQSPRKEALAQAIAQAKSEESLQPAAKAAVYLTFPENPPNWEGWTNDGARAYRYALLFEATGDEAYAKRAQTIIRSWTDTFAKITIPAPFLAWVKAKNGGGFQTLFFSWGLPPMTTAVELLSSTWKNWDSTLTTDYGKMCNDKLVFQLKAFQDSRLLPDTYQIWLNNWQTIVAEALLGIAILRNDQALMDYSQRCFKTIMDGHVKTINGQTIRDQYVVSNPIDASERGILAESWQDSWHPQAGLFGLLQFAEISWNQGIDLYSYNKNILKDAEEFQAKNANGPGTFSRRQYCWAENNTTDPLHPSNDKYLKIRTIQNGGIPPGYEVAYRHYAGRMHLALPYTKALVEKHRPEGIQYGWGYGTLTHALVSNMPTTISAPMTAMDKTKAKPDVDLLGRQTKSVSNALRIHSDGSISVEMGK